MTVRLRAHHLLCLLTYVGRGYSPAFVANLDAVAARLGEGGEEILIVDGPDDVCAPLFLAEDDPHCSGASARERDARAAVGAAAALGRPAEPGSRLALDRDTLARLRGGFAAGTIRSACVGCGWAALCTAVAGAGFAGTRLGGPAGGVVAAGAPPPGLPG